VKNAPTERVKIKKQDFVKRSNQRRKDVHPTVASISTYSLSQKKIVQRLVPKPVLWVAQRPVNAVTPNPVKAVAQRPVKAVAQRAVERPVPNPPMMCVAYV
jgi:hypothetical protein